MKRLTFNFNIFEVKDLQAAKQIILTPEGSTTEERWVRETPLVADMIGRAMSLTPDSVVIDYGCGIGRLAKELIARYGCRVVGVDISPAMRGFAVDYVASDRFKAVSRQMLDHEIAQQKRFDAAIAIWVLQHSPTPRDDIDRIKRALKPQGRFFVINGKYRSVPTVEEGWVNDGLNLKEMLAEAFTLEQDGQLTLDMTTPSLVETSFCALFSQRQP